MEPIPYLSTHLVRKHPSPLTPEKVYEVVRWTETGNPVIYLKVIGEWICGGELWEDYPYFRNLEEILK